MKVQGIPVAPEKPELLKSSSTSAASSQIDLYLTLKLNEQWESALGGRMKLGLRGGQLKLSIKNGKVPQEYCQLVRSVKLMIRNDRPNGEGGKVQPGEEAVVAEGQTGTPTHLNTQQIAQKSDRISFTTCQVVTKGVGENPIWMFAAEPGRSTLKGLIQNVKLATIDIIAKPCCVVATFEVAPHDLYLAEMDVSWRKKLSRKKSAVMERAIVRHLFQRKLTPYLSRQELQYD